MKRAHLTPKEYHALEFNKEELPDLAKAGPISASLLTAVRNPLEFLLAPPKKVTAQMEWGSLVDCMWTTPEHFADYYIVLPENAPQRPTEAMLNAKKPSDSSLERQRWWEEFERSVNGRTVVTHEMWQEARAAVRMLEDHDVAAGIKADSDRQVALVGDNPLMPNTQAKCLMDLLPLEGQWSFAVVDLKTTSSLSDYALRETMWDFDYVMKLGFYSLLAEAANYGIRCQAVIIWQSSRFPYEVKVREIPSKHLMIGREVAMKRMRKLASINPLRIADHYDLSVKEMGLADWHIDQYMRE